jgi:hypothetical protein
MGVPHPPEKALLFIAVLFSQKDILRSVLPILGERFGEVLLQSPEYAWDHTHYYEKELGTPLFRRFLFFKKAFDPLILPKVKLETNAIESAFTENGKRRINLDPGYIMRSRIVLASAKDYSHRIYLGKGIYGEVALYYKGRRYNPFPYTYYDYRKPECLDMFETAREELKRLKEDVRE